MLGIGSIVSCGVVSILISIWQCQRMGIYVCPKRRVRISNFIVIYKRKSCDVRTHYLKGTTRWWILYPRRCAILGVGQIAWFRELATVRRCGTVRAVTTSAAARHPAIDSIDRMTTSSGISFFFFFLQNTRHRVRENAFYAATFTCNTVIQKC
jgi:hypothetical protein